MAGFAVIALEGVLAQDDTTLVTAEPIKDGLGLYVALRKYYRIALLTLETDRSRAEHWLRGNGLTDYTSLHLADDHTHDHNTASLRRKQLRALRNQGYPIDLYFDSSPAAAAAGMHMGITSLLFASPKFARPEFRPDARTGVREWAVIEAEMHEQAALRGREPVPTADLES